MGLQPMIYFHYTLSADYCHNELYNQKFVKNATFPTAMSSNCETKKSTEFLHLRGKNQQIDIFA